MCLPSCLTSPTKNLRVKGTTERKRTRRRRGTRAAESVTKFEKRRRTVAGKEKENENVRGRKKETTKRKTETGTEKETKIGIGTEKKIWIRIEKLTKERTSPRNHRIRC